jgi:ABC-type multidrug transport system permease subunit
MWAVVTKELRQWRRDPQAAAAPMVLPLVLMALSAVLFGQGGDAWPAGLTNQSHGPAAEQLTRTFEAAHSGLSPYFQFVTRDAQEARRMVEQGRLHMAVVIPEDFERRLAAGDQATVRLSVFNINTDVTKNVRLRLDHVIQRYLEDEGDAGVVVAQSRTRRDEVSRGAFIAGGGVTLAILLGAVVNTALMAAREWERRTAKEIQLAAHAAPAVTAGKLTAGLIATAFNVALTVVVATAAFGLRVPVARWPALAVIGLLAAMAAAGVGLAVGTWLRDYRTVQPLLGVLFAGSFFASGGYASIATLPGAVRDANRFWPPSHVFEAMQWVMHGPFATLDGSLWFGLGVAAVGGVTLAVLAQRGANRPASG